MTDIKLFDFQGNNVRVVLIDNEPHFVLQDVCRVLGIEKSSNVGSRLPEIEKLIITEAETLARITGDPSVTVLTVVREPGLYRVIFQSRKPEAEEFKTWVFNEVLPVIRKTGSYSVHKKSQLELIAEGFAQMVIIEKEQQRQREKLEQIELEQQQQAKLNEAIAKDVQEIKLTQAKAEQLMQQFAKETGGIIAPEASSQSKLTWLVRSYCQQNSVGYNDLYNYLYREFYYRFRIDLKRRCKNAIAKSIVRKGTSITNYAYLSGHGEQLFTLAVDCLINGRWTNKAAV